MDRPFNSDQSAGQERELFAVVEGLARELQVQRAAEISISLASRLDRDLGIDSLGRTELVLRIERAFKVQLPADSLSEAQTVGDLLTALRRATPLVRRTHVTAPAPASLPTVSIPADAASLIDVLEWHAARCPDRLHLTLLEDERTVLGTMTYGEVAQTARSVAMSLIGLDVVPGDRVALVLPTGMDFFAGFFGTIYAGAVPVPIYPPARLAVLEEHMRRQAGILRNAGARVLLTLPEALRFASFLRGQVETLESVETLASLRERKVVAQLPPAPGANATTFIQYTSGVMAPL